MRSRSGALAVTFAILAAVPVACRNSAKTPAAGASSAPAPPATGPVNPDAGVTRYACADGETITAGYPDAQTAVVTYKDHAYTLKLARSADGARYVGYGLQWWTKGHHADLAPLKSGEETATSPGIGCDAQAAAPDAQVTRTSYHLN